MPLNVENLKPLKYRNTRKLENLSNPKSWKIESLESIKLVNSKNEQWPRASTPVESKRKRSKPSKVNHKPMHSL